MSWRTFSSHSYGTPNIRRRRPRGEGTIIKEGDHWVVRLWAGRRRLKRTCTTQAEALAALDDLKRQRALGLDGRRYSVANALDDFIAHGQSSRGWSPATVRSYRSAANLHLRPALGRKQLTALTVRDVQPILDELHASGHSGRHVSHVRAVLRAAINYAERQEIVSRNVARLAAVPATSRREMVALSPTELGRLFAALEGERLRPLIVTMATLGLRRGEAIALRWSDVSLDRATLTVRRTGSRIDRVYTEGEPKTPRSRRTLSLPGALVALLRRHSAALAEERLSLGAGWTDEDRVFPAEGGMALGPTTIRKALNRGTERAGLPHLRVHDLRHSAATALLALGGTIRDAQEMLGHTSYSFTADTYAHVLEDQRKATAERFEQALGGAIGGL